MTLSGRQPYSVNKTTCHTGCSFRVLAGNGVSSLLRHVPDGVLATPSPDLLKPPASNRRAASFF